MHHHHHYHHHHHPQHRASVHRCGAALIRVTFKFSKGKAMRNARMIWIFSIRKAIVNTSPPIFSRAPRGELVDVMLHAQPSRKHQMTETMESKRTFFTVKSVPFLSSFFARLFLLSVQKFFIVLCRRLFVTRWVVGWAGEQTNIIDNMQRVIMSIKVHEDQLFSTGRLGRMPHNSD